MTDTDHVNAEMSPRVILIDDDKDFLDAQVQALELTGFAIQACASEFIAITGNSYAGNRD